MMYMLHFGTSPVSIVYRNMMAKQMEMTQAALMATEKVGGYKLTTDQQKTFVETYFGMRAQMETQFNMNSHLREAMAEMKTPLKDQPAKTAEEYTGQIMQADSVETIEYFVAKKLPMPETTKVLIDYKRGSYSPHDTRMAIWTEVHNRNRYLTDKEPITAFKGIYSDKEMDKLVTLRAKDPNYKETPKAIFAAQAEYKMTALPPNYSYDIMMDLPLHNYLLNIEEACVESFRAQYCDRVTTRLYEATIKFGPVIRRQYNLIEMEIAVILNQEFPDLFKLLQEAGSFEEFKTFSQTMFNRLEYILVAYKSKNAPKVELMV